MFRYFPEIWQNTTELAKIVPIVPDFMNDVTAGTLPSYSIIHDLPEINAHDCTDPRACMGPVDDQLKATIDPYLNHPSFAANNDLLIVLFDEAQLTDPTCSGPTTIAMTEAARIRGAWTCGGRTVALFIGTASEARLPVDHPLSSRSVPAAVARRAQRDRLAAGRVRLRAQHGRVVDPVTPPDTTPPTVAAAPSGGSFASPQSVTLTAVDNNPGSSIYFTANGSTPTPASTRYTAPIAIATTTTLKFIAVDAAGNLSTVHSETYTLPSGPPPGALPSGWQTQDIGLVAVAGNASLTSGTYSVTGAGADIWGTADALRYAYTTLNGDGQITARVATEENVNVWTKAGVMIRESVAPGSRQALMLVSPGKGNAFQRRVATGDVSTHTAGALVTAPYWVRLSRVGNTITALESANGTTWTVVGSDTIAFAQTVLVGLAVSSHATTPAATATFDNVAIGSALVESGHWRRRPGRQHVPDRRRFHPDRRGRRYLGGGGRFPFHLSAAHRGRRDHRARHHPLANELLAQGRGDDPERPDAGIGARHDAGQFGQGAGFPAPRHRRRRQHQHRRPAAGRPAVGARSRARAT